MFEPDRIKALPKFDLVRHDSEEGRTYITPDGEKASVTNILQGTRDQTALLEWRESVGEKRADEIRDMAAFRGNRLHEAVENYLLTSQEPRFSFLVTPYWNSIRPFVRQIEHTVVLEARVWHPDGYAGSLDCLAYLPDDDDAQPTLLDWKTADKPLKPDKLYEYSLQVAAYRKAANHVYAPQGLSCNRAGIVVAQPDTRYEFHELDEDALDQLYRHFLARLQRFTYAR